MSEARLKALRLYNNHLTNKADKLSVVHDLLGLQAQFASNAIHALRIRSVGEYEPRPIDGLVKTWAIRGTMHIVTEQDLPVLLYNNRDEKVRAVDSFNADDHISAERKQFFAGIIVDCISRGLDSRMQLENECTAAGMSEEERRSLFDPWGGIFRALCSAGIICHSAAAVRHFVLCGSFEPMKKAKAVPLLLERYFRAYGPASVADASYFFGMSQRAIKAHMNDMELTRFKYGSRELFCAGNEPEDLPDIPKCVFLAGFDPLMLGYRKTDSIFIKAEHIREIFSRAGIVFPSLLIDGRVAGRWKLENGGLKVFAFETLSSESRNAIERCALETWDIIKSIRIL